MKAKESGNTSARTGPDSRAVQRMFEGIAPRYDFLNHCLSMSIDRRWRRLAAVRMREMLSASRIVASGGSGHCLDLCSGTGDLAIELQRSLGAIVVASDFCHPMLTRAAAKFHSSRQGSLISAVESDALAIPFADHSFDGVSIAFGLRNLEDRFRGLTEMRRVLKKDGALVILEFSRPVAPVLRQVFQFYFHTILPRVGAWVSGDHSAYQYLPDSVSTFPGQEQLAETMRAAGFNNVNYRNLSGGIAALHWGNKS